MSIYKHPNGRYYYNFMIDGKRFHGACKTTDPKIARKIELEAMDAVCRGKSEYFKKKKYTTLKQASEIYLKYAKENNLGYKTDKGIVDKFLDFWGPNKDVSELNPAACDDFKANMKYYPIERKIKVPNPEYGKKGVRKKFVKKSIIEQKEYSNATKNRHIAVLVRMLNICVDNGLIDRNPCSRMKKLREEDSKERRILEPGENEKIAEALKKAFEKNPEKTRDLADIIIFVQHTGARRFNIFNVKWEQINFKDKVIKFIKTKSGKAYEVCMNSELEKMLKRRLATSTSPYVFVNPETNMPYKDMKKSFKTLMKDAGVENFTLHCFRHTAITKVIEKTGDVLAGQYFAGHSKLTTTLIYHHMSEERKRKAAEALENSNCVIIV